MRCEHCASTGGARRAQNCALYTSVCFVVSVPLFAMCSSMFMLCVRMYAICRSHLFVNMRCRVLPSAEHKQDRKKGVRRGVLSSLLAVTNKEIAIVCKRNSLNKSSNAQESCKVAATSVLQRDCSLHFLLLLIARHW